MALKPPLNIVSKLNSRFAPLIALGCVCAVAFASVQVFGDPKDGGPRRVLTLNPAAAAAETAPRLSLSDAAAEGAELDLFGMDEYLPEAEPGDEIPETAAPGELRVAVAEAPDAARRPAAAPLARAPIAGLYEQGSNGPLPIIASNGRTPAQAYARPFSGDAQRPRVAIIIGGLGFNARATTQAINELPAEVTLSFVPYAADLQSWVDRARARGHEVMIELPMEPFDPDADDTGPLTLLASANAQQNLSRLETLLSRSAGYFGVTNYQGARFATSAAASAPIVQALRRRGLALVSSGIGQRSALSVEAGRAGLPNTAADRIIDARREADAIDEQLLNLEALALQNGSAIGAGFAYPVTMEQVNRWAAQISARGYQLAPASAVLNARSARR
jgi:hypothetical protein